MANVTVFAIFIVLIASFAINVYSARKRRSDRLQDYLFDGNTPLLALSSCIGSIISMAVSFTALLGAGYEWGWQMIFSLIAGCAAGLAATLKLIEHPRIEQNEERIERRAFIYGASYLAILGRQSITGYYVFLIAAYGTLLITEIVVLRVFLAFLTGLPTAELVLAVITILVVCFAYVYIGGFRGVLVTDYFQLLVVFVFIGILISSISVRSDIHIPSPITSRVTFTPVTATLLHVGIFTGAFAWTFASTDQWYRTVGTLQVRPARQVLIISAIALCMFSLVPIFVGAASVGRPDIPAGITNGVSMILIADLLSHANTTLRFVFAMALTCAALTTLNTYIMSLLQLYYEAETRVTGDGVFQYLLVKYPLKRKETRGVVGLIVAVAFFGSCFFPGRYVYAFGVFALSTFVLMVPFLIANLANVLAATRRAFVQRSLNFIGQSVTDHGGATITTGVIAWIALLALARVTLGALTAHLYVIPAAALGAAITAFAVVFLIHLSVAEGSAVA